MMAAPAQPPVSLPAASAPSAMHATSPRQMTTARLIPPRRFLRQCRAWKNRLKIADSMGRELTGGKTLVGALLFKRLLERHVLTPNDQTVGILLPPSVAGAVTNAALAIGRRVSVNLNYTLTESQVNYCIREAGIRHVITSRQFLEKRPMQLQAEVVFVEDLRARASKFDMALCAAAALAAPLWLLERQLGLTRIQPDDLLTIIFTSGSTGEPKGVMLTQANIDANIFAVEELIHLRPDEMVLGVLPFFHSFGYTITLWWPLTLNSGAVYHFNPMDARTVGELAEKYGSTVLMGAPTFLRGYVKRCTPQQFAKLDLVIVGAERMPPELSAEFEQKFGFVPAEGYGATELSPLAAVNVPVDRAVSPELGGMKAGTVGRLVPGVSAKTVDPDTLADLPKGETGLLWITGRNVMKGYLNQPDKTAEVLQGGWYNTGDIARIDDEGFIEITGRLSRFSKIGGEMVPHLRIESALLELVARPNGEADAHLSPAHQPTGKADKADSHDPDQEGPLLVVTAVPDPKRGERLIVLHRPLPLPVDQMIKAFAASGVPNLWIPDRAAFLPVETIPLLGTGKLDLKGVRDLALKLTAATPSN